MNCLVNINTVTNTDIDTHTQTQFLPHSSNLILGGGTTGEKMINMSHHIVILTQSCHENIPAALWVSPTPRDVCH